MTNNQLIAQRDIASARVHAIDKARILMGEGAETHSSLRIISELDQLWRDMEARAILAQRKLEREWNYFENADKDARWTEWKQACNYKKA